MSGLGVDPRRRLGRQCEPEALQQDLLIAVRLGMARQDNVAAIGGREVQVDHLHGLDFSKTALGVRPGVRARRRCLRVTCRQKAMKATKMWASMPIPKVLENFP